MHRSFCWFSRAAAHTLRVKSPFVVYPLNFIIYNFTLKSKAKTEKYSLNRIINGVANIKDYSIYQSTIKLQGSPFITPCLGSIELDRVISEPCYNGIIL